MNPEELRLYWKRKRAILTVNIPGTKQQLGVEVRTITAKNAFGRIDVEVAPAKGTGTAWVSAANLVRL